MMLIDTLRSLFAPVEAAKTAWGSRASGYWQITLKELSTGRSSRGYRGMHVKRDALAEKRDERRNQPRRVLKPPATLD